MILNLAVRLSFVGLFGNFICVIYFWLILLWVGLLNKLVGSPSSLITQIIQNKNSGHI